MMTRTAFVTGAAGFVGRHLTARLLAEGWTVHAYCRVEDDTSLLPSGVRLSTGNLLDEISLRAAFAATTSPVVFHLAGNTTTLAQHREAQFRDNVDGTRNVLDTAVRAGAARFVNTSSISAYGWQPGRRLREDSPTNVADKGDNYGRSKRAAEQLVRAASHVGRLSTVTLNPVNIIGSGDTANWSKQLILPMAYGALHVVPPGGATWISVHDVVSAHLAAVDAPLEGENVILGGVEATFLEVVQTIAALLGTPSPTRATSRSIFRLLFVASEITAKLTHNEPRLNLAKYRRATGNLLVDDARARELLGLRHTPLTDMLAETIDWLRHEALLPTTA